MHQLLRDLHDALPALKAPAPAPVITHEQVNEALRTVLGSLDNQATA
jgi:hypothetical protein